MSKGSKRPSWKVQRNLYNAITRDLAQQAAAMAPVPIQGCALPPLPVRQSKKAVTPREKPLMTERQQAIREWYLYGEADDEPPQGLTEEELQVVRQRWC